MVCVLCAFSSLLLSLWWILFQCCDILVWMFHHVALPRMSVGQRSYRLEHKVWQEAKCFSHKNGTLWQYSRSRARRIWQISTGNSHKYNMNWAVCGVATKLGIVMYWKWDRKVWFIQRAFTAPEQLVRLFICTDRYIFVCMKYLQGFQTWHLAVHLACLNQHRANSTALATYLIELSRVAVRCGAVRCGEIALYWLGPRDKTQ